jgi:hypothetical protein
MLQLDCDICWLLTKVITFNVAPLRCATACGAR